MTHTLPILVREIHRWMGTPFIWGETDCCLLMADWVRIARGLEFDPADHLRWAYDSAASCHRLTGWMRDPVAVVQGCADRVPLARTNTPVRGDIGLIRLPIDARMSVVGAIYLGGGQWVAKAPTGITTVREPEIVAAWGVDYADS